MRVFSDDLKTDLELGNLVETFRQHAMQLVNMLDISVPVVAKLKVRAAVQCQVCQLLEFCLEGHST